MSSSSINLLLPACEKFAGVFGVLRADRVARGIEHYRKTHKSWGRKKSITGEQEIKVVQLRKEGMSLRKVSDAVGISTASVQRILKTA